MAYNKTTWENAPSTNTPINAANLNKIEQGIYNNSIAIDEIDSNFDINTFTERVVDSRNANRYVDICWKKIGKIIQINVIATIPANAGSTMTMTNFNFTIPEWAKVSSNYTNVIFGTDIYLITALRSFIADSNGVQRGFLFNLLYNYDTNTQYIYGNLLNTTSSEATIQGSITYILD